MRRRLLGCFIIAFLFVASKVEATTVVRVPLEEMVRISALVVYGRVVAVDERAREDDSRNIWTTVTLEVYSVLKGNHAARTLTLRFPGGTAHGFTVDLIGMPKFRVGEEVVLFLEATTRGYTPAGLGLGTYRVVKDEGSQRKRAIRSLRGVMVFEKTPYGLVRETGPVSHADDEMDLEVLFQRVRAVVNSGGGQ